MLGANNLSWLEYLLKVAQARLENVAQSSGAENSWPMFWQLSCASSDSAKVTNVAMDVDGLEQLKVLWLLITGCNSKHGSCAT